MAGGSETDGLGTDALFERYATERDSCTRDRLVLAFEPLARRCARRYAGRGEPLDDLIQVASIGLLRAIERFDPSRGVPFVSFATPTIIGELRRHFRDTCWTINVPRVVKERRQVVGAILDDLLSQGRRVDPTYVADLTGLTVRDVDEILAARHAYRPVSLDAAPAGCGAPVALDGDTDPAAASLDRCQIDTMLRILPTREQVALRLRFYGELTQAEIAARLGTSQVHAGRLLAAAIRRLREEFDPTSTIPSDGERLHRSVRPARL